MAEPASGLRRPLAQAGLLIGAGLAVEVVTLFWSHPTAFLMFLGVGGLLVGSGVVRYLWALAAAPARPQSEDPGNRGRVETSGRSSRDAAR